MPLSPKITRRNWLIAGIALAALLAGLALPVKTIHAFCHNGTGSQYGYTEWIFGIRTGAWTYISPIELRYQAEGRDPPHGYVPTAGTQVNIFGVSLLHGHGRPHQLADEVRLLDRMDAAEGITIDWEQAADLLAEQVEYDEVTFAGLVEGL